MNRFTITLGIDGTSYAVTRLDAPADTLRAYRLTRQDGRGQYDVAQSIHGHAECSCPDYLFSHKDGSLCKHLRSLLELGLLCDLEAECYRRWSEHRAHLESLTEAAEAAQRAGLYQCDGCTDATCAACRLDRALAFELPPVTECSPACPALPLPEKCPF
jgi:hypothetical protein